MTRCVTLEGFDEARSSRSSVYVPLARLTKKRGDIAKALEYAQKALGAAERTRDEDLIAEACYALCGNRGRARQHRGVGRAPPARHRHLRAQQHAAGPRPRAHRGGGTGAAPEQSRGGDRLTRTRARSSRSRSTIASRSRRTTGSGERSSSSRDSARQRRSGWRRRGSRSKSATRRTSWRACCSTSASCARSRKRRRRRSAARSASSSGSNATHDLERARGALLRIKPAGKAPDQNVVGLYEVVKIINSSLNLNEVLNRVLDLAIRRLRAERGMILLLDPLTSALRTRVVRNINEADGGLEALAAVDRQGSDPDAGRSIMSADARADERFVESESVIAENILSILCVPLIIKDRIAGAIYVDHRQARHLFSQKDLSFLEAFADQAAIAIENARLYEELEEARTRLSLENESLRREVLVEKHLDSIVGQSEAVAKIQFAVRKASSSNSTVLLRGESGTGKGLIARIIHNMGPRRNGPFINFNCAALPETLAESELFGHEKGAFTGADRRKLGRFELANSGTIFLDEIGKMSLAMQAKLLRVVEDKEFERVGGTQTIKTDVKIIAATNLEIEKAIEDGSFREDLFYRLNIIPLQLPPLRERKDDIPLLAEHFIRKISKDLGIEPKRLEPGILDLFMRYHWPGNIRELEATLHRAIVMSNGDTMTRNEFYGLFGAPTR